MSTRTKLWLVPALLYAAFFYWYTDFRAPLSETEVDQLAATMKTNGSDPEVIAFIDKFARQDSGGQFLMMNNIDMNENPPDVEGAVPGESASDLMGRYMELMIPALLARACHPVLMGPAVYPPIHPQLLIGGIDILVALHKLLGQGLVDHHRHLHDRLIQWTARTRLVRSQ